LWSNPPPVTPNLSRPADGGDQGSVDDREGGGVERGRTAEKIGPLVPPSVPESSYDADYYLRHCAGAEAWRDSEGRCLDPLYAGALKQAGLARGERVVDIGTGRGELLVAAVEAGAASAIGVEYSSAALELCRRTLTVHGSPESARVILADARLLPIPDRDADVVTMLDVVEHLSPEELAQALREAWRVLHPGGRVFIHTMPNRLIYSITYRLQRGLAPWRWFRWPRDPRNEFERAMHVNEQTARSLRRALEDAAYERVRVRHGDWIHDEFVPSGRSRQLYRRLASRRLTRPLGAADLWAIGFKPD
jgi:ubiquinone/menaquinone biosynthesis C-methylase UbiE